MCLLLSFVYVTSCFNIFCSPSLLPVSFLKHQSCFWTKVSALLLGSEPLDLHILCLSGFWVWKPLPLLAATKHFMGVQVMFRFWPVSVGIVGCDSVLSLWHNTSMQLVTMCLAAWERLHQLRRLKKIHHSKTTVLPEPSHDDDKTW